MSRIDDEVEHLRVFFSAVQFKEEGRWVLIPDYRIVVVGWAPSDPNICFQISDAYPGAHPYGFYVPAGITFNGSRPSNYKEPLPNQPPFPGSWGQFSWQPDDGEWRPGATVKSGSNLADWVRGFTKRFEEGL